MLPLVLSGDTFYGYVAGSQTQLSSKTGSYHIAYLIDVDNSKLYGAYDNGSGWTFFSGTSGTKSSNTNLAVCYWSTIYKRTW